MKKRVLTAALGSVGLVIAAAAVVLFPSLAGAHTNAVTGISACADDSGTYTVTWSIKNSESNHTETATLVATGGGTLTPPTTLEIAAGGTGQVTQSGIPGSATTATLTVSAVWSDEATQSGQKGTVALSGTCTATLTPAAPTISQAECTAPGQASQATYTIPTTTGVDYLVNGSIISAGPHNIAQGTSVTITAAAQAGYTLQGTASWTLTATSVNCTLDATPATPTITQAACTTPGQASPATYTIPTTTGIDYLVNGAIIAAGPHDIAQGASVTITAAAQPGYTLKGTATWTLTATSVNCPVDATPVAPALTQAACIGTPGDVTTPSYTIPTTTGVDYLVNGSIVEAGPYTLAQGASVTITAAAQPGYVLKGTATFTLTATTIDCTAHVTVTPAVFANEKCVDLASVTGTLVVTAKTGVTYTVSPASAVIELATSSTGSAALPAGSYTVTPGVGVTVTAVASTGYTLDGTKVFSHTYPVALDCTEHVTPAAPAIIQTECTAPGTAADATYTIPTTTGIVYWVTDSETPAPAGTYPVAQGTTVIVHAYALPGYTLEGTDKWTVTAKVIDCTVTATPATPTYTTQQCVYPSYTVTPATVTVPSTTGVVYSVDGKVTPAGTVTVGVGPHAVTATPTTGYELIGYPVGGWTTTIAAVPCEVAVLAEPPVTPPSLASTGAAAVNLTVLGILVLLAGGGLVALTTRRRSNQA